MAQFRRPACSRTGPTDFYPCLRLSRPAHPNAVEFWNLRRLELETASLFREVAPSPSGECSKSKISSKNSKENPHVSTIILLELSIPHCGCVMRITQTFSTSACLRRRPPDDIKNEPAELLADPDRPAPIIATILWWSSPIKLWRTDEKLSGELINAV